MQYWVGHGTPTCPKSVNRQPSPRQSDLDLAARHAEQEAAARVRDGDPLALEMIFLNYHAELVGLAERISGSRDVGEEVVQDVFLAIWRGRSRWRIASSLRAYLRRAVQNTAARARASRSRGGDVDRHAPLEEGTAHAVADAGPTPADQAIFHDLAAAAERATAALSPRAKDVFLLRRDEELSNREIAERLGVSVKTVETHMGRALRFMRRRLARWLDE
jgi:RNA polymerase sigma-70 factor (ECF subfamily)